MNAQLCLPNPNNRCKELHSNYSNTHLPREQRYACLKSLEAEAVAVRLPLRVTPAKPDALPRNLKCSMLHMEYCILHEHILILHEHISYYNLRYCMLHIACCILHEQYPSAVYMMSDNSSSQKKREGQKHPAQMFCTQNDGVDRCSQMHIAYCMLRVAYYIVHTAQSMLISF